MDFPLDAADAPVYSGLGHIQSHRDFHTGAGTNPQVKYSPFLFGEIALPAEPLTFRLSELRFDVQGVSPLFDSSPLGLPLFLRYAVTFAIEVTSPCARTARHCCAQRYSPPPSGR